MKRITSILLIFAMLFMASCGAAETAPTEEPLTEEVETQVAETKISPGEYSGVADAYHGTLEVQVTVKEDGELSNIKVAQHEETEDIGTVAVDRQPEKILAAQSLAVDSVAGATVTCDAIAAAVADAITSAGGQPEDYGFVAAEQAEDKKSDVVPGSGELPEKAEKTGSVTVTDAKGREVEIPTPVTTYGISTMDVIDYLVPLLGEDAFHRLVATGKSGGKDAYDDTYFPMFDDLEARVGIISEHNAPFDLEMILDRQPDVLIINSAMGAHKYALEIEDQLMQAGIPLVLIDVPGKSVESSAQDTLKMLGEIFGEQQKAGEVVEFIDTQFALIHDKNLQQREDKPTVYYEKSGYSEIHGPTSSSESTGWGAVIGIAGAENIADPLLAESGAGKGGGNVIDPEYVLQEDPDYIILSGVNTMGIGSAPVSEYKFDIINRAGWDKLTAVQQKQVYEIMHEMSRTVVSFYPCLKLATIFYPEEFEDVDPDALLSEFYDNYSLIDSDLGVWTVQIP